MWASAGGRVGERVLGVDLLHGFDSNVGSRAFQGVVLRSGGGCSPSGQNFQKAVRDQIDRCDDVTFPFEHGRSLLGG